MAHNPFLQPLNDPIAKETGVFPEERMRHPADPSGGASKGVASKLAEARAKNNRLRA